MAIIKDGLIGHKEKLHQLEALFKSEKIGSCYLFIGASGIGKKKIAFSLIQLKLCQKSSAQTLTPCGACSSCTKMNLFSHEDVLYVEPDGVQIKIQQAEEIHRFLNLRTLGTHRFIVINDAHAMNPQAGNSLLKILEEPPANTTFIMISHLEHSVLRTLRSRSQVLHFSPLSPQELKKHTQLEDWIINSSQGRFDIIENLKNPEQAEIRQQAITNLQLLFEKNFRNYSFHLKETLLDKENSLKMLSYYQQLVRDALFIKEGLAPTIHLDKTQDLQSIAATHPEKLHDLFENLIQLEKDLYGNVDKQLGFENLMNNQ